MSDDITAFKADDNGEPGTGQHTATLVHAYVFESQRGDTFIKCEWQTTDLAYYWTALHGVKGGARPHTRRLLAALEIEIVGFDTWDQLGDLLAARQGNAYTVAVERNGNFLNTTIVGPATEQQPELPVAEPPVDGIPVDAADFAIKPAGGIFDDEDIPF